LLAKLEPHVELGDSVEVGGAMFGYYRVKSNVGYTDFFGFQADKDSRRVYLERPVNSERYLHRDFSVPLRGPSRFDLIAFGSRAESFVAALVAKHESAVEALDASIAKVVGCALERNEEA
jgi:hypothetical protein